MFDAALKSKVNREVGRLNGELCDLKEQEESLKIRRARLEVDMRQALAMRDMFELLGRLDKQSQSDGPAVRLEPVFEEVPNGPKFVVPGKPPVLATKPDAARMVIVPIKPVPAAKPRQTHKPEGLPTYQQMVQTVLNDAAPKWLAPRQITAVIRQTWWSDIPRHKAASTAWGMAQANMLDRRGGRYRVKPNGHAEEAAILGNGAAGSAG